VTVGVRLAHDRQAPPQTPPKAPSVSELTDAQHSRLDLLPDDFRVVGFDYARQSPDTAGS
jgi:hypothetical protein